MFLLVEDVVSNSVMRKISSAEQPQLEQNDALNHSLSEIKVLIYI